MPIRHLILSLTTLSLLACGDDTSDSNTREFTLNFAARVGHDDFSCEKTFEHIGTTHETLTVTDFKLYISNLRAIDAEGDEHPVQLDQDGIWQFENVALIDFEDAKGTCSNGTPQTNTTITGTTSAKEVAGVVFDIGVPEDLNHADSPTMPSPLNLTSMWWNWQFGYKFIRLEGKTTSLDGWMLHLGSTECTGEPGDEISCQRKNRPEIRMNDFHETLVFDVAALLATTDLSKDDGGPVGCMAGATDPECVTIFDTLGLNSQPQSIFSWQH